MNIVYQACHDGVYLPDNIVKELHPLHIPGVDFLHMVEDSAFDFLWIWVQEGGEIWPLQASFWEEEAMIIGI